MGFRCLLVIGCMCFALMAGAAPVPVAAQAQLTVPQREWLAQHPELRVGLVLQAPYAQYDRRLQRLSGANVELMQWLAKALNIELTWRNFPTLEQLEAALRDGEVDIAPGLQQTPAGLRLWLFTDPYMRVPQHIVGVREGGGAVELEKLDEHSRVAVRMPSAVADYLRSTYPGLNVQGVPIERQALQLLVSQQARYAVVDEAQLSRLSGEAEFSGLAVVGDIGLPQLLRVATRRDWPELAGIMESALRAIPARDLDQLHNRWLQPKYPRLSESPGLWQNLCLLLGLLLLASLAAETMLGYGPGALIERPLADFDPSLSMDRWLNLWKRARNSEDGPQHFAADCLRADGSILPAEVSLSFLRFAEGEYLVVYLNDVTERRRYVAALLQSEAQLRELSAHLETVREEEKARIAREVHDELGQMLTVLKLETSMCELAYAQLDPGLNERLNSMKRLIAQLFQLVRDVATALRPPILDAGIASAIEWQARRFEARTQIPCLVQVPDNLPALSDAKATGLFRILQEALTNVMRHAQAHSVEIELVHQGGQLRLTVSDDGQGFCREQP